MYVQLTSCVYGVVGRVSTGLVFRHYWPEFRGVLRTLSNNYDRENHVNTPLEFLQEFLVMGLCCGSSPEFTLTH